MSAVAAGLEDAISADVELGSSSTIARSEIRRSKSKVRSYLKKCKNAIIGTTSGHTDNQDPITHHEPISQQSATSSWYLDEISAEEKIGELINQPNDEELTTTSDKDAGNVAIAYDCSTTGEEEILDTSSDSHGFEVSFSDFYYYGFSMVFIFSLSLSCFIYDIGARDFVWLCASSVIHFGFPYICVLIIVNIDYYWRFIYVRI